MTKRNELEGRLQELFSASNEAKPLEQSQQPDSIDSPREMAPAEDSTLVATSMTSGTTNVPQQSSAGPAAGTGTAKMEIIEKFPPEHPVEQPAAPVASSHPIVSTAWHKQLQAFARQTKTTNTEHSRLSFLSNRSLRFKIIFAFLLVTVITVSAVTFVSDRTIRNELTQDVGQSLKSLAVSKAQEVGSLLINQVNILRSLALNDIINDGVTLANAAYTGDLAAIQAEINQLDQQWQAADAANNNADPLVQARLNNPLASTLTRFRESFPNNVEVFVTDQYGALLAATNRTSDYYQADEEWWQAAYNGGQGDIYIGQPEFDASSAALSVNIAVPLYARDARRVVGILRTTLDIGALQTILTQAGRADLLLPDGNLVRSEGGLVQAKPEMLTNLQGSASTNYAELTYEDRPSLVSQAPVTVLDAAEAEPITKLQWTFIVAQDSATALGPMNTAAQATLFSGIGTFLLAALLALGLVQILIRPITRLTVTAEKIVEGDLNAQARVESGDEIGQLATTFNLMTTQLRDTLAGLEQRVTVRTRDLTLAAEVGRSVSNVRELNTLLSNAVDLIRERFELYYTQVYLTDATGRRLILRAGTGPVGQALMQRNHQLPINRDSINGTAATEKRIVIVADTTSSAIFHPNPLLPDTRSEMAVPLIAGERVVGVLDLQSAQPGALTEENLPAFEALAGQMAIAIENAALFAETEQARAEVETQARRLTQTGWREFLDAVKRSERLGYTFDQQTLTPLIAPLPAATTPTALEVPILVTGTPIGSIQLERDTETGAAWNPADLELVNSVATRVATQVENLRLLAQAEQYRAEAETVMRRLTREGWETLRAHSELAPGYVYDRNEVQPLLEKSNDAAAGTLEQPLVVRDEPIGELTVDVETGSTETTEIVAAVAKRLSEHIENLRLSVQMQQALATTQKQAQREQALRQITSAVRSSTDPATIMRAAVRELGNVLGRKTLIQMATSAPGETAAPDGNAADSPTSSSSSNMSGGQK